jgi:hypothetical protein
MTTDESVIRKWFDDYPEMNWAYCLGPAHAAIDLDRKSKADGVAAFAEIEADQDPTNWISGGTLTIETPSSGLHLVVGVNSPVSNANGFPDGVDVRGQHGYCVGPGSRLADGREYRVLHDVPIKAAPLWIMARFTAPRERAANRDDIIGEWDEPGAIARATHFLSVTDPAVSGHNGDDHTYQTAARLRSLGITEGRAFELMTAPGGFNDRCDPPWSHSELLVKISNAYQYATRRAGDMGGGVLDEWERAYGRDNDATDVSTLKLDLLPDPSPDNDNTNSEFGRWGQRLTSALSLSAVGEELGRADFLIRGWVRSQGFTAFVMPRGHGKTVHMMGLGLDVATDRDFMGEPTKQGWHAIYCAGEDQEGAKGHADAYLIHHGLSGDPERFRFLPSVPNLLNDDDCKAFARYLPTVLPEGARALLLLDTWQRATTAASSQSDDASMQIAIANAEMIARAVNGCAVTANHPPKGNPDTISGSAIIENSSYGILVGSKNATTGVRTVRVERMKGTGEGNFFESEFVSVPLGGFDSFGVPITGAVAKRLKGSARDTAEDPRREAIALLIFETIVSAAESVTASGHKEWSPHAMAEALQEKSYSLAGATMRLPKARKLADDLIGLFENRPCLIPASGTGTQYLHLRTVGSRADGAKTRRFEVKEFEDDF